MRRPRYRPARKTFELYSINGLIVAYVVLRDEKDPPLTYLAAQELALDEQTLFPVSLEKARER